MITLRFVYTVPGDAASHAFEMQVPSLPAAERAVRQYEGDERALTVSATGPKGEWLGSARVGADTPAQFRWNQ
jgi:hypothetical protein